MSLSPEAIRLQRTRWAGKEDLLADELYLILLGDRDPNVLPVAVNTTTDQPDSTFTPQPYNPSTDPPPASFPSLYWPEFGPEPITRVPGGNGPDFKMVQRVRKSYVRTMLPAKVKSKQGGDGGDAATYTLTLYPNGTANKPEEVDKATLLGSGALVEGAWVSVYRFTELEVTEDVRIPNAGPLTSNTGGGTSGDGLAVASQFTPGLAAGSGSAPGEQVVAVHQKVKKRTHEIMPAGNSTFPAKITGGGPGADYQVDIYSSGPDEDATAGDATQLQISDEETIPVDTWVFVTQIGGVNYMQVPVWLTPAEST